MSKKQMRNLTAAEIVGQLNHAKRALGDFDREGGSRRRVKSIVMMGMGEPLYNYRNVVQALRIMQDTGLSRQKLTLSTSGVVPGIIKLAQEMPVPLAISLHAANDKLRNELVPINRLFPLSSLMKAVRDYPYRTTGGRITFEYVMLDGVNDSIMDAIDVAELLDGIPSLVNLIPFNPWPGSKYKSSSNNRIHRFAEALRSGASKLNGGGASLNVTVRWPRGRDIGAACGQLATGPKEADSAANSDSNSDSNSNSNF